MITKPIVTSFMFDRASVVNIYISEDLTQDMSRSMIRGHVVEANTITANPVRQTKKITVLFPNAMKCRKGPFNETDGDEFKLTNNIGVVEGSLFAGYQFYNSMVYWKLVVNRSEKRTIAPIAAPSDGEAAMLAACQRMSLKRNLKK